MAEVAISRRPGGRTANVTRLVFDATMALLVEGGFAAATFQAVAERAGVGRATLYRRWATPAELVADAVRASAAEAIAMPDTGRLPSDLRVVLNEIATFIATPLGAASLAASLAVPAGPAGARWPMRWLDIAQLYERAKTRGELAPDLDSEAHFARLAGALYFRRLVMGLPVDGAWIDRVLGAERLGA